MSDCCTPARSTRFNGLPALVTGAALFGAAAGAFAQSAPHVHGTGTLNLAIEGDILSVELEAPGADIVGFEYAPRSAPEREAVVGALDRLRDGARLFGLPEAANCALAEAQAETDMMAEEEGEQHGDQPEPRQMAHDRHHDGHHDEHHEELHGEPHHEHHDEPHGETHAEFHARYRFHCANPDALTYLDVTYFTLFPAARELAVQTITANGQGAASLTPKSTRLRL